jgi:hypothetical protein
MSLPKTLKFARVDGMTVSFPIVWDDVRVLVDSEWEMVKTPTLSVDDDEYLSDFVGHDIMPRVQYLWIDGNGILSADETSIDADGYIGTYTLI